jgi:hypothetical protein
MGETLWVRPYSDYRSKKLQHAHKNTTKIGGRPGCNVCSFALYASQARRPRHSGVVARSASQVEITKYSCSANSESHKWVPSFSRLCEDHFFQLVMENRLILLGVTALCLDFYPRFAAASEDRIAMLRVPLFLALFLAVRSRVGDSHWHLRCCPRWLGD